MPNASNSRLRFVNIMVTAVLGLILVAAVSLPPSLANGGKAKLLRLEALVLDKGKVRYEITSDIDPYLYALTSLNGKYKVLRVRIVNRGDKALALSAAQDHADVVFPDTTVAGALDLSTSDAALWDGLSQQLRRDVGFPALVEPGEEESLFIFVPGADRAGAPRQIKLTIAGLGSKPIELRSPAMPLAKF